MKHAHTIVAAFICTFALSSAAASPGIRILEPSRIEALTQLLVSGTVVKRYVRRKGSQRETYVVVKVNKLDVKHRPALRHGLRPGAHLVFVNRCSLRKPTARDLRMAGYPHDRCGGGWSATPQALRSKTGSNITLRLRVERYNKDVGFDTVATTVPGTARSIAYIGTPKRPW